MNHQVFVGSEKADAVKQLDNFKKSLGSRLELKDERHPPPEPNGPYIIVVEYTIRTDWSSRA